MKKLLAVILSAMLIISIFTACGNNSNSGETISNTLSFSQANSV